MCLDPNERTNACYWTLENSPLAPIHPSIYLSVHSGKSNEHKVSYHIVDLKTESPPPALDLDAFAQGNFFPERYSPGVCPVCLFRLMGYRSHVCR